MWRSTERATPGPDPGAGAMLGGEDELEAVRPCLEPGSCLLRRVGEMIVEDHPDHGARRIGRVEELRELDELTGAMAILDARMDRAGQMIDPGQEAQRAVAQVLVVAREGRVSAGSWRQARRRGADRLDAGFLVVGDDRHSPARRGLRGFLQDLDLLVDAQDFRRLGVEAGIAALEVGADLVRLHRLRVADLADRALSELGETGVRGVGPCSRAGLARSRVVYSSWG